MLTARAAFRAVKLPDGNVLAISGYTNPDTDPPTTACDLYDASTGSWQAARPLSVGRVLFEATYTNGLVYVFGGWTSTGPVDSIEAHQPYWELSLSIRNSGWGQVDVEPSLPYYVPNSVVKLTAVVTHEGRVWDGWAGDVDPNQRYVNPLTITMDSDKNISTAFKCGFGMAPMLPLMAAGLMGMVVMRRRRE